MLLLSDRHNLLIPAFIHNTAWQVFFLNCYKVLKCEIGGTDFSEYQCLLPFTHDLVQNKSWLKQHKEQHCITTPEQKYYDYRCLWLSGNTHQASAPSLPVTSISTANLKHTFKVILQSYSLIMPLSKSRGLRRDLMSRPVCISLTAGGVRSSCILSKLKTSNRSNTDEKNWSLLQYEDMRRSAESSEQPEMVAGSNMNLREHRR